MAQERLEVVHDLLAGRSFIPSFFEIKESAGA
jgi:hypothetical protein